MTQDTNTASGAADLLAMVNKALREAYKLGQRYWQQADSEYISQHKKADDTRSKFLALVEETCAALAAGQATAAQPAAQQGVAYAARPDLSDANGEIWSAIIYWKHAKRGEDALRKASELERVLSDQMHAFADATCALRASHGQAPATPKGGIDE